MGFADNGAPLKEIPAKAIGMTRLLPQTFGVFRLLDFVQPAREGLCLVAPSSSVQEKRKYPLTIKRPAGSTAISR